MMRSNVKDVSEDEGYPLLIEVRQSLGRTFCVLASSERSPHPRRC